jgi:hypothetical protein
MGLDDRSGLLLVTPLLLGSYAGSHAYSHSLLNNLTPKSLLALASTVILASEFQGTHDYISLFDGYGSLQYSWQ